MGKLIFVIVVLAVTLAVEAQLKSGISTIIESQVNQTSQWYMSQVQSVQPNIRRDANTRITVGKSILGSSSNWNKWLVNVTLLGATPEQREAAKSCYSEKDMDAKQTEFEAEAKKCVENNTSEVTAAEKNLQNEVSSFRSAMDPIIQDGKKCDMFDLVCVNNASTSSMQTRTKWNQMLSSDAMDLQNKGTVATTRIQACINNASNSRIAELNAIPAQVRACMTLAGKQNNSSSGNSNSNNNQGTGGQAPAAQTPSAQDSAAQDPAAAESEDSGTNNTGS